MTRTEAAKAGERFFTAKPCKRDGDTRRYTANRGCPTCAKASSAAENSEIRALIAEARRPI